MSLIYATFIDDFHFTFLLFHRLVAYIYNLPDSNRIQYYTDLLKRNKFAHQAIERVDSLLFIGLITIL